MIEISRREALFGIGGLVLAACSGRKIIVPEKPAVRITSTPNGKLEDFAAKASILPYVKQVNSKIDPKAELGVCNIPIYEGTLGNAKKVIGQFIDKYGLSSYCADGRNIQGEQRDFLKSKTGLDDAGLNRSFVKLYTGQKIILKAFSDQDDISILLGKTQALYDKMVSDFESLAVYVSPLPMDGIFDAWSGLQHVPLSYLIVELNQDKNKFDGPTNTVKLF